MKICMFVAEDGEAAQRLVRETNQRSIMVDPYIGDDAESVRLRQMYDITTRPAVLVTLDDGSYVRMWQGVLPSAAELAYVAQGR